MSEEDEESREDREERYADVDTSHLDDVEDGCGCAEMWEHTSGDRSDGEDAEADAA